jgi:hypothetical protein
LSNGEKKPGVKDISDLKARLGMLNKNVGAKPGAPEPPAAPAPSAVPTLTADTDADLGLETQVVRVEPRAQPREPSAPPAPPPAPLFEETPRPAPRTLPGPPAATPPPIAGGLNLGADLFKKPEPAPEPVRAAPAPAAPPPPVVPAAPLPQEKFVNPLAAVTPQRALTADDEAALNAVEKGQKGVRPMFLGAIASACAVVAGVMGFMAGTGSIQRELLSNQAKEAVAVRDRMLPILQKFEELANVVEPMNPEKVDWQAVQAMPQDLPGVDAAGILSTRVPLPAEVMSSLGKAVADMNQLFQLAVDHRSLTLTRDKPELEAMEKGASFSSNQYFAAVYAPLDPKTPPLKYVPPEAQIVAVVDKPHPDEKGENNVIKVKYRGGQETEVPLQRIVIVPKTELFEGGRQNVLSLYKHRVEYMKLKIKTIRTYSANLKEKLNAEAARAQ